MDLEELKERLKTIELSEIKTTTHAFKRLQDKKRKINYNFIIKILKSPEKLYKIEEQKAKKDNEFKFKLWFKLNYIYDMNIYIVINKITREKDLNRLEIISAHKVKRKIQERIKNETKN